MQDATIDCFLMEGGEEGHMKAEEAALLGGILAVVFYFFHSRRVVMAGVSRSADSTEFLDTLDVSRYRTEATVDTTIDD